MTQAPQIRNSRTGTIVRHTEFIQNISGTEDFSLFSLPINPGLDTVFPWLSQIAPAFEQYKWRGLVFTYKTTSADLVTGTNGALGQVIMATDYDSADADYTSQREMLNSEYAKSAKPSVSFVHPIETARSQTPYKLFYTREGDPPANADIRLYDVGKFQLATQGMQATGGTIGQLWVSYEIEFLKPQFKLDVGVEADHFTASTIPSEATSNWFPSTLKKVAGNLGFTRRSNTELACPQDSEGKKFQLVYAFQGGTPNAGAAMQLRIDSTPASGAQAVTALPTTGLVSGDVATQFTNDNTVNEVIFLCANFQVPVFDDPLSPPSLALERIGGTGNAPTGTLISYDVYINEIPQSFVADY